MQRSTTEPKLSRIETLWTLVCQVQQGTVVSAATAQEKLLVRYSPAIQRYLLGALRDPEAADELYQEFALRFVRGDLKGADRQRGRFRDFVKGVLFHLIADHHRRRQRRPLPLCDDLPEPAADEPTAESDRQFLENWRGELLSRVWNALSEHQAKTGQPFFAVLQFRAEHPDLRSEQMAQQLGPRLGKPVTAAAIRQTLHRAREKFAELLLDEVAQTLENPTVDQLEEELIDIGLHEYCRPALEQMRGTA